MHMRNHPSQDAEKGAGVKMEPVEFVEVEYPCILCRETFQSRDCLETHMGVHQSGQDLEEEKDGNEQTDFFVEVSYYFFFRI